MNRGPIKNRKTPCRHRVKDHKRLGSPVQTYMRGRGDKPKISRRMSRRVGGPPPRSVSMGYKSKGNPGPGHIVGNPRNPSGTEYDIRIFYTDARSERYSVDAKDYPSALTSGLSQRSTIEPPKMIRMRRG